jgi:dTDP-4-dehydrorhamnose 3,5-epimerase-like enzyme
MNGPESLRNGVRWLEFPVVHDERGNLSFIEGGRHVPFPIARVYWIYDVPGGEVRGGHAFRQLDEVIIAISGSFDVAVDTGDGYEQLYHLNRSYRGVYVPRMTWRQLRHFSTNAVALILASEPFDPDDYIYEYNEFMKKVKGRDDID